jgi:hypothetical protein
MQNYAICLGINRKPRRARILSGRNRAPNSTINVHEFGDEDVAGLTGETAVK